MLVLSDFTMQNTSWQDVLTGEAEYDGIPAWLSSKFSPSTHPYPWPLKDTSGFSTWACGYFTERISHSFQQLYTQHQTEFARVWREIALRFRDNSGVLGYELMNEPWTGDFYQVRGETTNNSLINSETGPELAAPGQCWLLSAGAFLQLGQCRHQRGGRREADILGARHLRLLHQCLYHCPVLISSH